MKHKLGALIGMAVDQAALPTLTETVPSQITPPVVPDYRMDGNDKLGDCVAEGTIVEGAEALQGYRAPYSGPVVTLRFASGKELTVTPNHAILTPRGFVRARFLNKGDNAISATGAQDFVPTSDHNVNQAPARIEEIVASFHGGRHTARQGTHLGDMHSSINFHGDERFVDGDIQVETSDRFLQGKVGHSALAEPGSQNGVGDPGELQGGFHRPSSALKRHLGRRASSLGLIRPGSQGFPFGPSHLGVAESDSLADGTSSNPGFVQLLQEPRLVNPSFLSQLNRSFASDVALKERREVRRMASHEDSARFSGATELVASVLYPSSEGGSTDPHLATQLAKRFPGQVALEEIVDVDLHWYRGHVYDLSTSTRWYTANSIVAHNCTIAGADHCTAAWNVIYSLDLPRLSESQLEQTYFRLGHNQDLGLPEQTVVAAWKRESAPTWFGYQITGGVQVANSSIKQVIATKGVAYLGVALPSVAEQQFAEGQPWSVVPGATIAGGHCVVGVGYVSQFLTVVTWGKTQKVTWDWWQTYGFECWSLTVPQIHKVN